MPGIIVSDTSSLIVLKKIGRLEILRTLFGQITITQEVAKEFNNPLPNFISIQNPKDKNYQKILESFLDEGEASAIALAIETKECLLIIDDSKGRREARALEINYTGILGILIIAKEKNIINSVSTIIEDIQKTDFRLSQKLIEEAKRKSGE
jgi:predicted nucleic acid-binding protein